MFAERERSTTCSIGDELTLAPSTTSSGPPTCCSAAPAASAVFAERPGVARVRGVPATGDELHSDGEALLEAGLLWSLAWAGHPPPGSDNGPFG